MSTTSTYTVTGMTCGHCVSAVTTELTAVPGVQAVDVDLVPGGVSTVRVSSEGPLTVEQIREAVDEAGYELTGAA